MKIVFIISMIYAFILISTQLTWWGTRLMLSLPGWINRNNRYVFVYAMVILAGFLFYTKLG